VLGRLELALGDLAAADRYLHDLPGRLLSAGYTDPTASGWADAIETSIALGRLDQARGWLEQHERHVRRLASPITTASALRCRGLLAAADRKFEAAFTAFERSLALDPTGRFPLERARTLLCLGTARRQAGQKRAAREALEQALVILEQLGAPPWAEKARAELRRISGRRPPGATLTEMEERAASLAATGLANKEIAAALVVSEHTVEAYLTRAYRKLGVRTRTQLGRRLGQPAKPPDDARQT